VLYIARDLHPMLQPARYGGGMVDEVSLDHPRWQPFPRLFEAGTPALAELCGHRAALEWLAKTRLRLPVHEHEHACTRRFIEGLRALDDTYLILGDIHHIMSAGHVVSFYHPRFHAHDLAWFLGQQRICVRSGHQCAQPLHQHLGCAASVRVSIGAYTTIQDIDTCLSALAEAHTVL
jgi:cysteine desulfurase/selenocysteine lyase